MAKAALHKIGDIRAKTPDELADLLLELRKEQFNLRFQRATGQNEGSGPGEAGSTGNRPDQNDPGPTQT